MVGEDGEGGRIVVVKMVIKLGRLLGVGEVDSGIASGMGDRCLDLMVVIMGMGIVVEMVEE